MTNISNKEDSVTQPVIDKTITPETAAQVANETKNISSKTDKPRKKSMYWGFVIVFAVLLLIYLKGKNDATLIQSQSNIPIYSPQQISTVKTTNTQINQLTQALAHLQQQVNAQDSSPWQNALLELQTQQQQLIQNYRYLYQQQRHLGDKTDWFLAETGYLLRVAQQRLYLEQDIFSAIKALKTASQRLGQNNDPYLLPLREAIIQDLHHLQALPTADIEGIALSLLDYIKQTQRLPLVQGVTQMLKQHEQTQTIIDPEKKWLDYLYEIGQQLKSLVIVRYNANHQAAVLSPKQRFFVQQNLQLKLASARLLVLYKNDTGFQAALSDALNWLNDYYDQNNNAVQSLQKQLKQWQQQSLTITHTPDLSLSLKQFKRLNALANYSSQVPQIMRHKP